MILLGGVPTESMLVCTAFAAWAADAKATAGRKKRFKAERQQHAAAVKIQTRIRGRSARRLLGRGSQPSGNSSGGGPSSSSGGGKRAATAAKPRRNISKRAGGSGGRGGAACRLRGPPTEDQAVTKLQAAVRGRQSRRNLKPTSRGLGGNIPKRPQRGGLRASSKHRGTSFVAGKSRSCDEDAAAERGRLEGAERGRQRVAEEQAAVSLQSVARGRAARSKLKNQRKRQQPKSSDGGAQRKPAARSSAATAAAAAAAAAAAVTRPASRPSSRESDTAAAELAEAEQASADRPAFDFRSLGLPLGFAGAGGDNTAELAKLVGMGAGEVDAVRAALAVAAAEQTDSTPPAAQPKAIRPTSASRRAARAAAVAAAASGSRPSSASSSRGGSRPSSAASSRSASSAGSSGSRTALSSAAKPPVKPTPQAAELERIARRRAEAAAGQDLHVLLQRSASNSPPVTEGSGAANDTTGSSGSGSGSGGSSSSSSKPVPDAVELEKINALRAKYGVAPVLPLGDSSSSSASEEDGEDDYEAEVVCPRCTRICSAMEERCFGCKSSLVGAELL